MKSFSAAQIPLIERPHAEPLYFAHLYLDGETLYFSDRNFKFNGHDYEAYLLDIPETVHSIEQTGGYRNIDAQLTFWNKPFKSYGKLIDYFIANPLTRKEIDLFILYLDSGQIPGSDISTKLHRLGFGEISDIKTQTFSVRLSSILHLVDRKKIFTQINRTLWPNAAPDAIGRYENQIMGSLRNIPCHPVSVGAISTLFSDLSATATEIYLSDVDYPIAFPSSGTIQIGIEQITYTSKDSVNKKLTGCTRGFPARAQIRGEPVWEIKANYKYLAAGHKMKSISDVYIAGVRVASGDRTVNLDNSGKSTITFTSKTLLKNQGAHSHGSKITEPFDPAGSSFSYDSDMGAWGAAANLKDKNEGSGCGVARTGALGSNKDAYFTVTFPSWGGITPNAVYIYVVCNWNLGFLAGEYFNLTTPESIPIGIQGQSVSTYTAKIKLASTTPPTTVTLKAHTNSGNPVNLIVSVYEIWLVLEFDNIASGGENSVWGQLAPLVTCDGEGYQDDASGKYTGAANALIENHSDVRRFLLVGLLGRPMPEIGASFTIMRTDSDQKFGMIFSKIGMTPEALFSSLDDQSWYQMKEDAGKFELVKKWGYETTDSLPTDGTGITASTTYSGSYLARYSCDDNLSTYWMAAAEAYPSWLKVDFGAGNEKKIGRLNLLPWYNPAGSRVKDFILAGSNNDTDYTTLYSGQHPNTGDWQIGDFGNDMAFRYYKLTIINGWAAGGTPSVFEWQLHEIFDPPSVLTIDKKIYVGDPVFSYTPEVNIKNLIRAVYDLDYSGVGGTKKFGDYFKQVERSDAASITKYGELPEDVSFPAIQSDSMAEDVASWQLSIRKDIVPLVSLSCNRRARILERGDCFILNDCPVAAWEGGKWSILEIQEIPARQRFEIKAIQDVS